MDNQTWPKIVRLVIDSNCNQRKLATYRQRFGYVSQTGSTLLHYAILGDNMQTIGCLLDNGLSLSATNHFGESPLHWACRSASPEVLQLLLMRGADINLADNDGNTPLHWAASEDNIPAIQLLLAAGAPTETKNRELLQPSDVASPQGANIIDPHSHQPFRWLLRRVRRNLHLG